MKSVTYLLLMFLFTFSMLSCENEPSKPAPVTEKPKTEIAFIGTYTQKEGHVDGKGLGVGIYQTGAIATDWKLLDSFSDIINPSYICLSTKHPIIYAVSEQGPNVPEPKSVIKVIQYDPETYETKELQSISALGHAPCYISTDQNGKYLFVANYVSGNVIQYAIKSDGSLEPGIANQHIGKGDHPRQEAPHAHYIKAHPGNDRNTIYAVDLGIDKIYEYDARQEGLMLKDSISTEPGSGPRHLDWHPEGNHVFVLNELSGTIEYWKWTTLDKERLQIIDLKPEGSDGFAGASDIHISNDGQYIYAALRGDFNEIVCLKNDTESKQLSVIQRIPAGGKTPRNFSLSPKEDYLAVASQDEDVVALFKRDQNTGMLSSNPEIVNIKTPVCIQYLK